MNGEVNGMMEETADNSVPSPQETGKNDSIVTSVPSPKETGTIDTVDTEHSADENTAEDDGNVENASKGNNDEHADETHRNGNDNGEQEPSKAETETDMPKVETKPDVPKVETKADVPKVETKTNDTVNINNHCSNSNDSCADSITSSAARSESASQGADGKNKDSMDLRGMESCTESESDDDSILSGHELKAADTVSIDSDSDDEGDDSGRESRTKSKNSDIIILDAENRPGSLNGNSRDTGSPEIHEITSDNDNDDCVVTDSSPAPNSLLRRNNKRKWKQYDDMMNGDDESDIEEIELDDPLDGKPKSAPKVAKLTDKWGILERLQLAAKTKADQGSDNHQDSAVGKIPQNLYQSMVARGLVVTPTGGSKSTSSTQVSPVLPTPPAAILPSLTDDMFVVEAPSFIVPYVYEKPSVKPFREFVDKLGKELEDIKANEDKERLEKEKEEKEKREQDRKERRERGEEVEDSPAEEAQNSINEEKKKKKAEKRARRKARDDDDASWDGESSSDSDEDETLSDDDTVVLKDKLDPIDEIKQVTELVTDKVLSGVKGDNYFDCSLGKFFVGIGLNLVQEYVQNDLLKQQNRKLYREKKAGHNTKATLTSIASLTKNLDFSKENNAPYTFTQIKCEHCSFKTESELVMKNHMEIPHMKNNLYKCNFCEFEIKSPHDILSHMEKNHNIRGRLERAPAVHQCPNCPFEDSGKGKLGRHQIACAKRYKPELNLAPPMEWEPPAKIPKVTRARNVGNMAPYQSLLKGQIGALGRGVIQSGFRARGRSPAAQSPLRGTPLSGTPVVRGGMLIRHNAPPTNMLPNNYPIANNGKPKPVHQPSISITPLPHQQQPPQAPNQPSSKSTFVICEICDGYIKDLEQLRNHMQWIHKVKIHPKMIYNRPPLNCQKCQFRFFTDQGLERHLLGSHGLVTSSMQEAANKGKDAGRCPVCGRVYQWKLLNHVARDHNLTLKPAHLSYKCTVCTATFGMYKQFENHVYSAHSVVAKRVMDKTKTSTPAKPGGETLLKPIKIRDEVTITPQPVKPQTSAKK